MASDASSLPSGTVTFLFTDIEGSTRLWQEFPEEMPGALKQHHALLQTIIDKHNGYVFQIIGDAFCVAFESASQALAASLEIQLSLKEARWDKTGPILVRTALHTGPVELKVGEHISGEYESGLTLSQASRLLSAGHGGQILLSSVTAQLVLDYLPEGVILKDLGAHRLKDLDRADTIYQVMAPDLPSDFPPLKTLDAHPNNLPIQPTPFVGRQDELADLDNLISDPDNRLISIVGAGGMGKTRLALAEAEHQLYAITSSNGKEEPRFPDGVFLVRLAPLETTEAMIPTIAEATGFQFYEGVEPKQQILDFFREKRLLLLMDNFEHLMEGVSLLPEITQAAPDVKILVTSREKLNLSGEVTYPLRGMRFPEEEEFELSGEEKPYSSVELFLQCAKRSIPDFSPNDEELKSIGYICRLVEGMPLGVELAAAWMEMLVPGEIASEIQKSLDFLEAEAIDIPDRHRSIRTVFDYTWKLLGGDQQEIMKKVSVFRGGFTAEAAYEVAGASLKQLLRLVNKSLLQRSSTGRLNMHELLRKYASEKLRPDEEIQARNQHCEYFAEFLHRREAIIRCGEQNEALKEMDNIRSGLKWAVTQRKIPEIRKQILSLWWLHQFQGWSNETTAFLEFAAREIGTEETKGDIGILYAQILVLLGASYVSAGQRKAGTKCLQKSQEILRQLDAQLELAWANGAVALFDEPFTFRDSEEQAFQESLLTYQENGLRWGIAFTLSWWANRMIYSGRGRRYEDAGRLYNEALQINIDLQDQRGIAWCIGGLGMIARYQGEYKKAKKFLEESLRVMDAIGNKIVVGNCLEGLGDMAIHMGEYREGEAYHLEALRVRRSIGHQVGIATSIADLGTIALFMCNYELARERCQEALEAFQDFGEQVLAGYVLGKLGDIAIAVGDLQEARSMYHSAMEIEVDSQHIPLCMNILTGVATLLVSAGESPLAMELVALVQNHPQIGPEAQLRAKKVFDKLKAKLPPDIIKEAQQRSQEREILSTAEEMLDWLENVDLEKLVGDTGVS